MQKFSLTPSSIKEWQSEQWMILGALILVIAGFSVLVVACIIDEQLGRYMLSLSIVVILGLTTVTLIYGTDHELHVHHWTISLILCCYLCHQNYIVLALHGLLNGIMIEGIARWGLDPVWERTYA